MNKLLSVLIAAAFITPAFAADAPKTAAKPEAKAEAKAEVKADAKPEAKAESKAKAGDASAQLVTPASDAAAMNEILAKMKAAAKGKTAEAQPEAKK